ncbi:MAG: hypothetical protein IGS38_06485 [Synechococcales cyanobacterium M58_A2018_015]|nr:hypothetical protein [Synechococcales cyanobacterium M58_A2018_015]
MLPEVMPLRAIVLQSLLLLVAIAIEAIVLQRLFRTANDERLTPKQSLHYAASINLLSTVLGWFAIFSFLGIGTELAAGVTQEVEVALLDFIFFNRFTNQSLSLLTLIGFFTFFASFAVKQVGLWGLRWLLYADFTPPATSSEAEGGTRSLDWTRRALFNPPESLRERSAPIVGIRDLRTDPDDEDLLDAQLNITAVLFANAWSYTAILLILLLLAI